MKVLVTGGAGYIGSCVVEELLNSGHKPVVFDTFFWGREALEGLEDKVEIIEGDVRNSMDVVYALDGVDFVVHLAGIVGQPACSKNPLAHYTANVESIRTLVNCMTDHESFNVRDFIFCSSCSVYGNVCGIYDEVTESTPTMPLSLYADGKLRAENIIMQKAAEYPNFHPTILRLTTIFGWSPRPRLDLVTNQFAHQALEKKKLTIFGSGSQYRSLVHVRDVASAVVRTMESPRYLRDRQVFHVGEETNNKTIREIAEIVKQYVPDTDIEFSNENDTDFRDYRINCQRMKNVLNWRAKYSVEDGIKEMVEKLQENLINPEDMKYRNNTYEYR